MCSAEEENFQRISEDVADLYTEIHLCMKEAGKKGDANLRQSCTKAACKVKEGEGNKHQTQW